MLPVGIYQCLPLFLTKKTFKMLEGISEMLIANGLEIALSELVEKGIVPLCYEDLPTDLWETSILKPYTYYYHHILSFGSENASYNPITNTFKEPKRHYKEMRILYTKEDLLNYIYTKLKTDLSVREYKRDIGAIDYLLKRAKHFEIGNTKIESIDYLLYVVDYAASYKHTAYMNILEIFNIYASQALVLLNEKHIIKQSTFTLRTGEVVVCG